MKNPVNKHIPKVFNYIWLGDKKMPEDYFKAMEELAVVAERDGFSVNICVDRSSLEANGEALKKIPNLNIQSTEELLIAMANAPDSPFTEDEKANLIKIILFECLSPANYAAASDFLRMIILLKGGVYLDGDTQLKSDRDAKLPLHEALVLDEIAKGDGVYHPPAGGNSLIICTEGNAKIIDCIREMIRKTTASYSMLESEYNELLNKSNEWNYLCGWGWTKDMSLGERLEKIKDIESMPGFDKEYLSDPFISQKNCFFRSEEKFLVARKSPLFLSSDEAGIHSSGTEFYLELLCGGKYPYRFMFTVSICPVCLELHSPSNGKEKLHSSIIEVFDTSRLDNTWIDKTEKTPEQREEIKNKTEKSVKFFLEHINPLSLGDLLKVLAHKGDLHEALSLVKSNANSNEVVPGVWAQKVRAEEEAVGAQSMVRGS